MSRHARILTPVLIVAALTASAQTSPSVRHRIDAYMTAIAAAESGETARGVESALTAVADLKQALLAHVPGSTKSVLEDLPEADFALLEQLPGVTVRRVEVLVVHPIPRFFSDLATRVGDRADQRFAAALVATHPESHWPVYVEPQTDYSGCTAFGDGRLLEVYLAWSAMERDFPGRYESAVSRQRDAVEEKITRSTCACGDSASVVEELKRIVAALTPEDPIFSAVRQRLAATEAGRSNIRFGCIPR
ncbi:MAG: hypothetical protein OXQ90_14480 [Gammaproteobacteria bacterium]|nr:hypothetical protein [Gammaproteobacteria bacterium]